MKSGFRLSTLVIALTSLAFTSLSASAQENSSYGRGYDHGYEDGYDDAMYDCPCPPGRRLVPGLYVGAGGGYQGFQINRNAFLDGNKIGSLTTHANGFNERIYGGVGQYYRNFFLAFEFFFGMSSASGNDYINNPGTNYYGSFSAGKSYGASILPGYRITESGPLVYGRLGYIDTQFNANDFSGSTGGKYSTWSSGFNSGVGVEIPITNKWSTRFEYDYIKYSSFNHNTPTAASTNGPASNGIELDLTYHLDLGRF